MAAIVLVEAEAVIADAMIVAAAVEAAIAATIAVAAAMKIAEAAAMANAAAKAAAVKTVDQNLRTISQIVKKKTGDVRLPCGHPDSPGFFVYAAPLAARRILSYRAASIGWFN